MISLNYVLGKEVRGLTEVVTLGSRAMDIVVTIVMSRSPRGRGSNQSLGM